MKWFYLPIGAIALVAIFAIISYTTKRAEAKVFKLDSIAAEMNLETKGTIGEVNVTLYDYVSLNVATDETFTLGVNLTDVFQVWA